MAGCGTDESGDAFGSSTDGRVWTWSMPFDSIEDRLCPSGTVGRVRCAYLFPGLDAGPLPVDDAGDADAGALPPDAGDIVDAGGASDAGGVEDAGQQADGGVPEPEPEAADGGTPPVPPVCACDGAGDDDRRPVEFAIVALFAAAAVFFRRVRSVRR